MVVIWLFCKRNYPLVSKHKKKLGYEKKYLFGEFAVVQVFLQLGLNLHVSQHHFVI